MQKVMERMARKHFLLLPNSALVEFWAIYCMGPLIIYSCLAVPVTVAFEMETPKAEEYVMYVCDALFGLDMIVNFRLAFFSEENDLSALHFVPAGRTVATRLPCTRSDSEHVHETLCAERVAARCHCNLRL